MPVSARKGLIRKEMSERRAVFCTTEAAREGSLLAQAALLAAFPPGRGMRAALYVPLRGEVGTEEVCRGWLDAGGAVFYPAAAPGGGLRFFPRPADGGWVRGPHGVPEPPPAEGEGESRFDLMVVPAVAFDGAGTRLGRGAGCYDRFLASIPRPAALVGLVWSWQVVDALPVDDWDVPVDAVVTEKGVLRPSAARPDST